MLLGFQQSSQVSAGVASSVLGDQVGAYTSVFNNTTVVNGVYRLRHPFNTKSVVVQVYDDNNQMVLPSEIILINNYLIDIDLSGSSSIVGDWRVTVLSNTGGTKQIRSFTQNFTQTDITVNEDITFTHNIGSEGVFVQVFDNNGNLVLPSSIDVLDANRVRVSVADGGPLVGSWSVQILGDKEEAKKVTSYARSFKDEDLVAGVLEVEHMLNTLNVVVQVYDENNQMVLPSEITRVGLDNASISFAGAEEGIAGEWQVTVVAAATDVPLSPESMVSTLVPLAATSILDTVTTSEYEALSYFMSIRNTTQEACLDFKVLKGSIPPTFQIFSEIGDNSFYTLSAEVVNEKTHILLSNFSTEDVHVSFLRKTLTS